MNEMVIELWKDGRSYTHRRNVPVPAVGDYIIFDDALYKVEKRIWNYAPDTTRIAVSIEPVEETNE